MRKPFWASAAGALLVATALAGCGPDGDGSEGAVLRVYVSLPLAGTSGPDGRDAADGARLALAEAGGRAGGEAVEAIFLDATDGRGARARWTPARAAANARAATGDSTAIAYLGDFESGATRASLPWTNEARMLQVSPAGTAIDLVAPFAGSDDLPATQPSGARSFGRVIPADDAQARAGAGWAERLGARRIATLDDGSAFGEQMVDGFEDSLRSATLTGRRPQLLYYAGEPGSEPPPLAARVPRLIVTDAELAAGPGAQPAGTLATSAALDPARLPPAGREMARRFRAEFGRAPGRYAAYGYEAMAVILDSLGRASDPTDRVSVIDAFLATADRESVLGTYSIDEVGDTTLDRLTGYELRGGRAEPVADLRASP